MEVKTGTDIIEIERIKESIEKFGDTFLNKIYTQKEIQYCESKKNQKYQHYAARFAVKEATFKALSSFYEYCDWKKYEIVNDEKGKPILNVRDNIQNLESIDVSISHIEKYAVANVVVLFK